MKKLLMAVVALALFGAGFGGGYATNALSLIGETEPVAFEAFPFLNAKGERGCYALQYDGSGLRMRTAFTAEGKINLGIGHEWAEIGNTADLVVDIDGQTIPVEVNSFGGVIDDEQAIQLLINLENAERVEVRQTGQLIGKATQLGEPFRAATAACREWIAAS